MKAQVLFDAAGKVHAMLIPTTGVRRSEESQPRAVFRPGPGQRTAELDIPSDLRGMRLLEIHAAVVVDVTDKEPRLVRNPAAPTLPLPPPRHI